MKSFKNLNFLKLRRSTIKEKQEIKLNTFFQKDFKLNFNILSARKRNFKDLINYQLVD